MIMFTPVRIAQAASVFLVLAGCASQPHTTLSDAAPAQPAQPQASGALSLTAPPEPPSVQAGQSCANGGPLLQPGGTLSPELEAFARGVARTRGVPLAHVEKLLQSVSYNATALRLMKPSKRRIRRSWTVYRQRFIEPVRI